MVKIKFWFFLFICFCCPAISLSAQNDIETRLVFSNTVDFNFTSEWQYLSTDIYLFNGTQFSKLINELEINRGRRGFLGRTRFAEETFEHLFITAQLSGLKIFGDNIIYPIYNFQITKSRDNRYNTFVSDNIDHIRIIDNLPIYTTGNFIDAVIRVRAITRNDRDQMFRLVGSQLVSLSKIPTPTNAMLSLIGELGQFMESSSLNREYRFSSTIRLYEQKNFDTRLHSIKVFALVTGKSQPVEINTFYLSDFLTGNDNPEINRKILEELLNYKDYPILVVVNYRSLYKMERISGNEITAASIERRKIRVENDFKAGLINQDTYRQERDFIVFLNAFATFKSNLEMYSLNFRAGNIDAATRGLFQIVQQYRQLLRLFEEFEFKNRDNLVFRRIFQSEYETILGYASFYLENDHNLRNAKEMVNTIIKLERGDIPSLDFNLRENALRALGFIELMDTEQVKRSSEGQIILRLIREIESQHYEKGFKPSVLMLQNTPAQSSTLNIRNQVASLARETNCSFCRDRVMETVVDYNKRLKRYFLEKEQSITDSLKHIAENKIFDFIEKKEIIEFNIKNHSGIDTLAATTRILLGRFNRLKINLNNFIEFARISPVSNEPEIHREYNSRLKENMIALESEFNNICSRQPLMCQPISITREQAAEKNKHKKIEIISHPNDSIIPMKNEN